jgi:hypothetical protein
VLKDPNWLEAMTKEYRALLSNDTWDLVPPPRNANIFSGKWVFRHKLKPDGLSTATSSTRLLNWITVSLCSEFAMKDTGSLHYFLGIAVTRDSSGMHLSQAKYTAKIPENAGMTACKSSSTPVDTSPKLSASASPHVADPTEYQSLVGALQYLTFTRPDITYAVQQVCLHMHDLHEQHLAAIKRILHYVKGTLSHGLQLHSSSPASMVLHRRRLGRLP